MKIIEFNITPIAKPRMTQRDKWARRPCVERYKKYCDDLRILAKANKYKIGPTLKDIIFILPMSKSWGKKKQSCMNGMPHQQRPDLSNLIKAFEDALAKEDSFIWTYQNISKIWGRGGKIIII